MRHLLLILVLLVAGYGAWHLSSKARRDQALHLLSKHGLRLGVLVLIVLALLAVAYYSTSTRIL